MEQRVALLVAAGRTTAEVAAELRLSAKTVEWHLSRAFRKLHVRSRDDLAALLARDNGDRLGTVSRVASRQMTGAPRRRNNE
jgi:DNA-binding NarL/FixJ family response regulator